MQLMTGQISLELTVLGYQFPEATDFYDANWLMVQLQMGTPWGLWTRVDPCLEVREAQRLLNWFQELERNFDFIAGWGTGHLDTSECFTEPNLEFKARGGQLIARFEGTVALEISFSHEFLPPFASELPYYADPDEEQVQQVYLRFYLTREQLKTLISQWQQDLAPFPERYSLDN
ncbi:WapI family immunity protein [Deinococcus cellulosilyticus]|uniref:Uncharacterized protein n=1 Tax=Deinococcus cellulosilyticus (strain DSM 18568 / NBRC 106333 / KACC 11606 / 5516J-15) TaxID=1223518 RepID=A0A511NCQ6_DEIC1|nr:hypothetical protein [Deinococcus cellulosilyticus]GEM50121.1 hypothetical protein DC3_57560 [Deinococcus cellulosilyticus NBRC 106333 = KACC 11606]